MSRKIVVGAAQLGPIQRADSKGSVVERMLALMSRAKARDAISSFSRNWR